MSDSHHADHNFATARVCELMNMQVQLILGYFHIARSNGGVEVPDTQVTPRCGDLTALNAWCALHLGKFEAWAAQGTIPAFGWWDKPATKKVVSIGGTPLPESSVPEEISTPYEQPMPFAPGPYMLSNSKFIFDRNNKQIAQVDNTANGFLFAGAWEALTMLHEYVSTDQCTHAEGAGEACRFCVSMNIIRRSMGEPNEQVPLLTWFGRFKEQQQIAKNYKDLYDKERVHRNQVVADIQERIFTLRAKLDRMRVPYPTQAVALGNAIAEISLIKGELEK